MTEQQIKPDNQLTDAEFQRLNVSLPPATPPTPLQVERPIPASGHQATSNELAAKFVEVKPVLDAAQESMKQAQLMQAAEQPQLTTRSYAHYTPPLELDIQDVDVRGRPINIKVVIPNDFDTSRWGILQRAAVAKADATNTWSKHSMPTIINAIIYADKRGLSFEDGDVYIVAGRLNKTAMARVKCAMNTGKIKDFTMDTVLDGTVEIENRAMNIRNPQPIKLPWLTCTIVVQRSDWDKPCPPYVATITEWFDQNNPNWIRRPRYMLEQNALGHALERAVAVGDSRDEAPTEG